MKNKIYLFIKGLCQGVCFPSFKIQDEHFFNVQRVETGER
jgi:hypothetical protein